MTTAPTDNWGVVSQEPNITFDSSSYQLLFHGLPDPSFHPNFFAAIKFDILAWDEIFGWMFILISYEGRFLFSGHGHILDMVNGIILNDPCIGLVDMH